MRFSTSKRAESNAREKLNWSTVKLSKLLDPLYVEGRTTRKPNNGAVDTTAAKTYRLALDVTEIYQSYSTANFVIASGGRNNSEEMLAKSAQSYDSLRTWS